MKSWEEFREEVRRRKRERWIDILNSEPPGRVPGRRPRDPEQEAILTEIDRRRIERSEILATRKREPVDRDESSD
jgi:hypothetical protein